MPRRDDFTSTVDGAAAHAALFSDYDPADDRPDWGDVGYDPPRPPVPLCNLRREKDGVVSYCAQPQGHGPDVLHRASLWSTCTVEEDAYWRANVPF